MSSEGKIAYPVEQAREKLSLGRSSMYNLIAREEIEVVRIGRKILVPRDSLNNFIRRRKRREARQQEAAQ